MDKLLPLYPHCALICGQTGCGKTEFILDLLENYYKDHFQHGIILCPTFKLNKTYQLREWIKKDPNVHVVNPGDRLDECLAHFHEKFKGESTLFILDDCSVTEDIRKKRNTLCQLAFSGRHADHSVWILTQKYNSVVKDFREQLKWIGMFYCKDRDSFEMCLRENDVIPTNEERLRVKEELGNHKYSKLILKTDQPRNYKILY